ncbi:MAG: hypothetical protein KDC95_11090 [Planctomycetes bacterium]|nr:hypothetical protein [Planctomycetota bacterium]
MNLQALILGSLLLATTATAQTQLVRGDVDSIQNTNRWRLDCTNIELVSNTVNLQALHDASRQQDIEYEMQVRDVSTSTQTILNVISATTIPQLFDMGNIRLGRSDRWHVLGPQGHLAIVYLTGNASNTAYLPLGSMGTWLLTNFTMLTGGQIPATGRFEFSLQPPNNASLVGMDFTGQAITVGGGTVLITNAQCKTVRAN